MTNIKKFLKKYQVKDLVFFNGHSNLTESYLCEHIEDSHRATRNTTENKRIIVALKISQTDLGKVQEKVDKLCNLNKETKVTFLSIHYSATRIYVVQRMPQI